MNNIALTFILCSYTALCNSIKNMRNLLTVFVLTGLLVIINAGDRWHQQMERIDCYPDQKSPFSKVECLARSCLFDDDARPNEIQCYTVEINQNNEELHSMLRRRIHTIKTEESKLTKQIQDIIAVEIPDIVKNDPKYRIDCSPDIDEYRSFCTIGLSQNQTLNTTNQSCTARGCAWDANPGSGITTCYVPIEIGGYKLNGTSNQLSNASTQYGITRISNEFSIFNHDINNLDVEVSVSGIDMIRMTVGDRNNKRYEVPVPITWNPSVPSYSPRIKFQMTNTPNGQVGFRVERTDKQSVLFDTSFFANGFVYDDKFIQIVTTIPSRNIYGIEIFQIKICIAFISLRLR